MAEEPKNPLNRATILGVDWPGRPLPMMPGDFSRYTPQGMGLGTPLIVRPWDDPVAVLSGPNYYGFEPRISDPVRGAPIQDPAAGILYFDDGVTWAELEVTLHVIGTRLLERDFAVFLGHSDDPQTERYLDQVRIVQKFALVHLFGAGNDVGELKPQPVTVGEFIEQFLADQKAKWSHSRYAFGGSIAGTFGGDGDWAKESLAFGFMVENPYWAVYRMWSRAWLVTK
jgi:hypothetical protein